MTNTSIPFLTPDEVDDVVLACTKVGHDHIIPLILEKERIAILHYRLHAMGLETDPRHTAVLALRDQVNDDLFKAWSAPFN